jgi:hypothetical protein
MECVVCLVLSYAGQSYDGMICVVYPASPSTMECVVCLVLSYAGQSYDGMVCVVYPASPSTMDLWYVLSCPMPARTMTVWYAWRCPTSPRPAILRYARSYPMPPPAGAGFYVFRPITSDVGLSASVWSTQDHTRPPLGGVAPRRAEVPTGGTHTPVFDSTVRSGRGLGATCSPHARRVLWGRARAPTSQLLVAAPRAVSKMGM